MADLIDKNMLLNPLNWKRLSASAYRELARTVNAMPAVNVEPVIHAEWRFDSGCGRVKHYRCSKCGRMVCSFGNIPLLEEFPYCNCGAKMAVNKPVESVDNLGGINNDRN